MKVRTKNVFTTIRSEGAMLPTDLLSRVVEGDKDLDGLTPADYHLLPDEKLNEAISRSWSRLRGAWAGLMGALEKLAVGEAAVGLTRDRFLLPLFQELGYGRLTVEKSLVVGERSFPISHRWQQTPIHLVGFGVDLDKRTKRVAGAAQSSPHSLVQECLNRSDAHLWAFVSNGRRLRILRDNASLTRQAYVEFDLEAMMAGEVYADFVLLWLLCHQSRVEGEVPEKCWLEQWSKAANDQGKRALEDLRGGVQAAIEQLGQGFLAHSANRALREKLYSGELSTQDYYRQLLRLVYRLLFLFVAEDRDLLLDPGATAAAKDRYRLYYSTVKLRALAEKRRGSRHNDLFVGLRLVMEKLGSAQGCPEIGLPALGSFLWSAAAVRDLFGGQGEEKEQLELGEAVEESAEACEIANGDLLDGVRSLAFISDKHGRRPVDYKNLQSEELGSVYESLLELHPELNAAAGTFVLKAASGNERKTTGSYYTPESLVQCLLDSALDPVLDEAAKKEDAEAAILALKVCDPACGSGHFLIAAAHRMAKRLAFVRTGEVEPSLVETQRALRDVIGRCMYGVDINPMAVELCKVALWMEALEPGKPLSFLDHHIQCGNSLIGATPALLKQGIPDAAFKPIEGDDKEYCKKYKKQNKEERKGQMKLFDPDRDNMPWQQLGNLAVSMTRLDDIADDDIAGIERKREWYEEMVRSAPYLYGQFRADAWCAAFVWKKTNEFPYPITEDVFRRIERNPHNVDNWIREEVRMLSRRYQFFHWHIAFPDVFRALEKTETAWSSGFNVILGNPPWDSVEFKTEEFFADSAPTVAEASNNAQRQQLISELKKLDFELFSLYRDEKYFLESLKSFMKKSGRYSGTAVGTINIYGLFAELSTSIANSKSRIGIIIPTSIATDWTYRLFFRELASSNQLASLIDFQNRRSDGSIWFKDVHSSYKFCLFTLAKNYSGTGKLCFFAEHPSDINAESKSFELSGADILRINPNTLTIPVFSHRRDAEISRKIYSSALALVRENKELGDKNEWEVVFKQGLFNISTSSKFFVTEKNALSKGWKQKEDAFVENSGRTWIPVYEDWMIHHFDHRYNSDDSERVTSIEHEDPKYLPKPRYWIDESRVVEASKDLDQKEWFIAFRDRGRSTDSRTAIFSVIPKSGVTHPIPIITSPLFNSKLSCVALANFNSYAFDYIVRQKLSGYHLTFYVVKQQPVIPPEYYSQEQVGFVFKRGLELVYTAWNLQPFAQDCGYNGPPFRWNESRRFLLRCELDAAYFHLYNIQRDDVDYIMETFPIVKRKDEKNYEYYRTKTTILQIYDAMATAIETGQPYQTLLDPPPADPSVAHPPRSENSV